MKITDVKTFVVGNPPPHFGGNFFVFVKLTTSTGIEGIGEVYAAAFSPHVVATMTEDEMRDEAAPRSSKAFQTRGSPTTQPFLWALKGSLAWSLSMSRQGHLAIAGNVSLNHPP